jgi:hypothetical protein
MKRTIVVLLLLALVLMPNVSFSRNEPRSPKTHVDERQLLFIKTKFRNIRIDLSKLRNDLKTLSIPMTAHESVESYLIRCSHDKIGSMEAICRYLENMTDKLSHVEKDKLSHYCYLQKHGIEQMKNRSNEYLNNIKKIRTQISSTAAMELIDQAAEKISSSSGLIEIVVDMLQRCSGEEKPGLHH